MFDTHLQRLSVLKKAGHNRPPGHQHTSQRYTYGKI